MPSSSQTPKQSARSIAHPGRSLPNAGAIPVPADLPATGHDLAARVRPGQARHRSPAAKMTVLGRRVKVAALFVQSKTLDQIAEACEVHPTTIKSDLKFIRQAWKETIVRDFDESVVLELQKLDRVESEAWDAWERSKQPSSVTTVDKDRHGCVKGWTIKEEDQVGDPQYLSIINRAIERRCKLLGLDAPTKTESRVDGQLNVSATISPVLIRRESMRAELLQRAEETIRRGARLPDSLIEKVRQSSTSN